jgi:hypothetical protein
MLGLSVRLDFCIGDKKSDKCVNGGNDHQLLFQHRVLHGENLW